MFFTLISLLKGSQFRLPLILVFIILVLILFTFYFFAHGPATPLPPDGFQVSGGQDRSEDREPLPEMLNLEHGLEMVREMVGLSDDYGVVDEDAMSERVKQLICEEEDLRNSYLRYRQKAWDLRQGARAEDSAGLFDNPGYLPSLSPLVQGALAKDSHSESEPEE